MSDRVFNVLFLCTGNSARSILAEAILNRVGEGRFNAYSAGSHPKGSVHPFALALLQANGFPVDALRSKSWEEFSGPHAPPLDFVVTVCDNAAGELCPVWPGHPVTAHWGIEDPADAQGPEAHKRKAFCQAYARLNARIGQFVGLPIATLEGNSLVAKLREIGHLRQEFEQP